MKLADFPAMLLSSAKVNDLLRPGPVLVRLALPVPWTVVARRRDPDGSRTRYAAPKRGLAASGAAKKRCATIGVVLIHMMNSADQLKN